MLFLTLQRHFDAKRTESMWVFLFSDLNFITFIRWKKSKKKEKTKAIPSSSYKMQNIFMILRFEFFARLDLSLV